MPSRNKLVHLLFPILSDSLPFVDYPVTVLRILTNPLVFYGILKLLTLLMPDVPFRLAFTNGLMSESMALWFGSLLVRYGRTAPRRYDKLIEFQ